MKTSILALAAVLAFAVSPARADSTFEPPVPVRTTSPVFPYDLRREGVSGVVFISCLIDAKGNVTETKIVKSTQTGFEQPAVDAVKKWKFKPAQRDGSNVPVRVSIPIRFNIDD